jgi:co-chaperonin GroES (HSP10)
MSETMKQMWRLATRMLVLAVVVAAPVALGAHEGHVHKVLGTVTAHDQQRVDVKTQDGKVVSVTIDAKTTVARGTKALTEADVKIGDRVVIDVGDGKTMVARSIKLGAK